MDREGWLRGSGLWYVEVRDEAAEGGHATASSGKAVFVLASAGQFLMGASGGRFRRNGVGKKVLLSAEEGRIDGKEDADGAGKTGKIDFIRRNGVFGAEVIIKKGWLVAPLIKEFFVVVEEPAKVV